LEIKSFTINPSRIDEVFRPIFHSQRDEEFSFLKHLNCILAKDLLNAS
jgi:hypothetical protein